MWWKSRCKDEWLRTYQINIYDGESWKDEIQKEQQMLLTYIFSQLNVHFQWLALTLKLLYNLLLNLSFQTSKPVCETLFLCQNILKFCEIFMFCYVDWLLGSIIYGRLNNYINLYEIKTRALRIAICLNAFVKTNVVLRYKSF